MSTVELPDKYAGRERGAVLGADGDEVYVHVKRHNATEGPNTVIDRDVFKLALRELGIEEEQ